MFQLPGICRSERFPSHDRVDRIWERMNDIKARRLCDSEGAPPIESVREIEISFERQKGLTGRRHVPRFYDAFIAF